jgi:hypothetical protein
MNEILKTYIKKCYQELFNIHYHLSSTCDTHTQVHLRLLLIIYTCGTCSNVARHNIPEVYALFTRTLKLLSEVFSKQLNTGALVFVLAGRYHWIFVYLCVPAVVMATRRVCSGRHGSAVKNTVGNARITLWHIRVTIVAVETQQRFLCALLSSMSLSAVQKY